MKYKHFNIEDFLEDDNFVRWVLTGEENEFWQTYLVNQPHQKKVMDEAQKLILQIYLAEENENPILPQCEIWARLKKQMDSLTEPEVFEPTQGKIVKQVIWKWAASISILLAAMGYLWYIQKSDRINYQDLTEIAKDNYQLVEKVNNGNAPLKIMLEDSSVVVLSTKSKISYPEHFTGTKREIYLSGEASFEVKRNVQKPFYVYSNELVTKVLGTKFTIKAEDNDDKIIVDVKSGKVSVFKQNKIDIADAETKGLILLPNQKALFNRINEKLNRRLVDVPMPIVALGAREKKYFEEVPVSQILVLLEKYYGVKIIYNEDLLADCVITTTLDNEPLYEILDVLCNTIGASYKEIDAQIIIESEGCN